MKLLQIPSSVQHEPKPSRTMTTLNALFASPVAALVSLLSAGLLAWMAWHVTAWLVLDAAAPWSPAATCREVTGACWPFIVEKTRFILFGTYPYELHWRPLLVSLMLIGISIYLGLQATGRLPRIGAVNTTLLFLVVVCLSYGLMAGGFLSMRPVDMTRWNGLPVLLILSVLSIAGAFPLGVLLALARTQSTYPLLARTAAVYVEAMRGVPMVSVLFVGIFVLPLMLPPGTSISPVNATLVALVLFHAAYFAEDVRGGLQGLPAGQTEAGQALGLGYWRTAWLVILPQAIPRCLPSLVNSIIGAYKDTSLVVILGIHDMTATARMAFNDPLWRGYSLEAYAFVGLWFFLSCAFLSHVGRRVQQATIRKDRPLHS